MTVIVNSFAQFLPYIFMLCIVGVIWDKVVSAFRGWF